MIEEKRPQGINKFHQSWSAAAIIFGIVFGYSPLVLIADSMGTPYLQVWLEITAPLTNFLNSIVPGAETRLIGISGVGFEHRVPLLAHLYAAAMVIGCAVGFYLRVIVENRTTEFFDRFGMNAASLFGAINITIGLGLVIYLHVGRDVVPSPTLRGMRLISGYSNNFHAAVEIFLYTSFFMVAAGGIVTFIFAFIRPLIAKNAS